MCESLCESPKALAKTLKHLIKKFIWDCIHHTRAKDVSCIRPLDQTIRRPELGIQRATLRRFWPEIDRPKVYSAQSCIHWQQMIVLQSSNSITIQ